MEKLGNAARQAMLFPSPEEEKEWRRVLSDLDEGCERLFPADLGGADELDFQTAPGNPERLALHADTLASSLPMEKLLCNAPARRGSLICVPHGTAMAEE